MHLSQFYSAPSSTNMDLASKASGSVARLSGIEKRTYSRSNKNVLAVVCFHAMAVYPRFGTIFLPSISPQNLPEKLVMQLCWGQGARRNGSFGASNCSCKRSRYPQRRPENLAITFYCQPQMKINCIYIVLLHIQLYTMNLIYLLEKEEVHMLFLNIQTFQIQVLDITDVTKYLYRSSLTKRTWHPATAKTETWFGWLALHFTSLD